MSSQICRKKPNFSDYHKSKIATGYFPLEGGGNSRDRLAGEEVSSSTITTSGPRPRMDSLALEQSLPPEAQHWLPVLRDMLLAGTGFHELHSPESDDPAYQELLQILATLNFASPSLDLDLASALVDGMELVRRRASFRVREGSRAPAVRWTPFDCAFSDFRSAAAAESGVAVIRTSYDITTPTHRFRDELLGRMQSSRYL